MAVPAGHIGRVLAQQRLAADHGILQHLVERVADVDVAICIGRAIVKHELLAPRAGLAERDGADRPELADVHELHRVDEDDRGEDDGRRGEPQPAGPERPDAVEQAGLHRKVGLRQEHRVSEIALFSHCRRALAVGRLLRNLLVQPSSARACTQSASICATSVGMSANFASGRRKCLSSTSICCP